MGLVEAERAPPTGQQRVQGTFGHGTGTFVTLSGFPCQRSTDPCRATPRSLP